MLDCSRCDVTVVIHGVTFFGGGLAGEIAFPSKGLAMGVGAFARAIIRCKGLTWGVAPHPLQLRSTAMTSKIDLPVHRARAYLEPGPVLLVTSCHAGERNVMTLGWHLVMEFSPSLVGCMISAGNHSFDLIRASRECVLNLPTLTQIDDVVAIGNRSGRDHDKIAELDLATGQPEAVAAPLLSACHANFECRLADDRMVDDYNLFLFEIVKAHLEPTPKHPKTLHYSGDGAFVVAGKVVSRRRDFRPALLGNGR